MQKRFVQSYSEGPAGLFQIGQAGTDFLGWLQAEQTRNRQRQYRFDLAIIYRTETTTDSDQTVQGKSDFIPLTPIAIKLCESWATEQAIAPRCKPLPRIRPRAGRRWSP